MSPLISLCQNMHSKNEKLVSVKTLEKYDLTVTTSFIFLIMNATVFNL